MLVLQTVTPATREPCRVNRAATPIVSDTAPARATAPGLQLAGRCEAILEGGQVLHGTLVPTALSAPVLSLRRPDATSLNVPRRALRLLRLDRLPGHAAAADEPPRRCLVELPGAPTVAVDCEGSFSADDGGQWLLVRTPSGSPQSWWLAPASLPRLRWLPAAAGDVASTRSADGLWALLQRLPSGRVVRLGQALVERGFVSPAQLSRALEAQRQREPRPLLGQLLVEQEALTASQLEQALSEWMGVPCVDLTQLTAEPAALARLPRSMAERESVLPLLLRDDTLVVAVPDAWSQPLLDSLRFVTDLRIVPVTAAPGTLLPAIARAYSERGAERPVASASAAASVQELAAELRAGGSGEDSDAAVISESDNTLVRTLNALITEAVRKGASDIHIETAESPRPVRVRLRIDGELQHFLDLPSRLRYAVVARLKIMADLDINEHRKPQDGKISFARFGGPKVELRVVTVPTQHGLEDVVLRLLSGLKPMPLDQIGLSPSNLALLREVMAKAYGLILICGPTGCGKTTTLHSVMRELNTDKRKIWTAEDPVEIAHEGLRQVQVNPRIGLTFASAMRTFLRADPDVIMIGEMRDEETARIAVEASLTGHLVMSTLHTNSAPESITRLLEIGLDPYMFSDSLLAIVAQRLVRRLCLHCRVAEVQSPQQIEALAHHYLASGAAQGSDDESLPALVERWRQQHGRPDGSIVVWHHAGCPHCEQTGYHGRLGLHEVMMASEAARELIRHHATAAELQACALAQGMVTLWQDGIDKLLLGLTDLPEVLAASNQ